MNGVYVKILPLILLYISTNTFASEFDVHTYSSSIDFAQITEVLATQQSNDTWCFSVTVKHNDEGWEHFADGWEVIDLEGKQLGYRQLSHPHVNEQPFTRSQCNIKISSEISHVIVRAKCNKHGFGGKAFGVKLKAKEK